MADAPGAIRWYVDVAGIALPAAEDVVRTGREERDEHVDGLR